MAKLIKFDAEARAAMMRGVNILAYTVLIGLCALLNKTKSLLFSNNFLRVKIAPS